MLANTGSQKMLKKLELYRAHTPCAPYICAVWRDTRPALLTITTRPYVHVHMSRKHMAYSGQGLMGMATMVN